MPSVQSSSLLCWHKVELFMNSIDHYYDARNVASLRHQFCTHRCVIPYLPKNKDAFILDIGCGVGNFIGDCVVTHKRVNVKGVDISDDAVKYAQSINLPVEKIESIESFAQSASEKYDFILMSHVLEHIDKKSIIGTLRIIKDRLLKDDGVLFIVVPNAQSSTHAYWAYEDFTHTVLFTTGSLIYVLKSAGFSYDLVDLDSFIGGAPWSNRFRRILLPIYKKLKQFERYITQSYYHQPSPISFAYELKIVGYKKSE